MHGKVKTYLIAVLWSNNPPTLPLPIQPTTLPPSFFFLSHSMFTQNTFLINSSIAAFLYKMKWFHNCWVIWSHLIWLYFITHVSTSWPFHINESSFILLFLTPSLLNFLLFYIQEAVQIKQYKPLNLFNYSFVSSS